MSFVSDSASVRRSVSMMRSGFSGSVKLDPAPVKFLISPFACLA